MAEVRVVVIDADELRRLIGDAVRAATSERRSGDEWVDARGSGIGRRLFLRLAREGAFPVSKRGKAYVARRSDVDDYLERQRVQPGKASREPHAESRSTSPAGVLTDPTHDPVARALAAGRLRVVKKLE